MSPVAKPGFAPPAGQQPAPTPTSARAFASVAAAVSGGRLKSLDAFRGFIMFMLAAGGFGTVQMARKFPDAGWATAARQFSHTPWQWGVFSDLIMPAFLLMVGVALGGTHAPLWEHLLVLGAIWGVAWWLWRRKIFFRV